VVATAPALPRILGRYALYDVIASGGMATVHFGRLQGPVGFARTVAIKRLHPQFARDPEFVSMFLDEARLAARIRHPNVVPTLDVVALEGELFLVMEYVQGEPLGALLRGSRERREKIPIAYAVAIVAGALRGLHAAHEAKDERGSPLGIVHRDISPQNIIVGVDGVPRVLDFGVAKAAGRLQVTRDGQIKGKIAYMSPEQIRSSGTDRRTDIYAAGAVLWEALAGARLFHADNDVAVLAKVLEGKVPPPSALTKGIPPELDAIVAQALSKSPDDRFATARDMARMLDGVVPLVPTAEIGEWVETVGAEHLATRTQTVSRIEGDSSSGYQTGDVGGSGPPPPVVPSLSPRQHVGSQPPLPPPGERTEVSGSSVMHSAVVPRIDRRWMVLLGAGGGLTLVMIIVLAKLVFSAGDTAAPEVAHALPLAPPVASTAPPPVAEAPPPPIAAPVAPPAPPPPAPPPVRVSPPSPPVAAVRSPPVTAASPASASKRTPPPMTHALDTVLDSRK
jgi:serine/threonine protein kinase